MCDTVTSSFNLIPLAPSFIDLSNLKDFLRRGKVLLDGILPLKADQEMEFNTVDTQLREEIIHKLKEELESGICDELTSIWTELWDENERIKRKEILAAECQKEIREFLLEVFKNEKTVRDSYIVRIEELLAEMHDLQKSLEITIPYEDVANLPLHTMAAHLNKKAEKYRVIKNERIHKLNELSQKEIALCEKLGMIRQAGNMSEIPKTEELVTLENHIVAMEQEKVNRTVTFLEQRQNIIKLFEELGTEPLLSFEKEIVSEQTIEKFALTNENMQKLDELRSRLETQLDEARQKVEELIEKLTLLWNYVGETEEYKKEFLKDKQGYTVQVINALKEELSKCETKKRENIAVIVERIRQVLVEEWDRCLIGQEEREKFRPFKVNCFTEDLCDLHELEIKRLKNFYHDNEQIFILIGKHEKLFNKLLELENRSKNANRYYNRGGQLLQEEKERKLITKELPVVEEELRALLKKYEETHGKPFTSFGVPMELILDEQWNAHFDQKTIEKLCRKKGERKGRTPLGKRGCTTPYTPLSANKVPKLNGDKTVSSTTTPRIPTRGMLIRKKKADDNEALQLEPTYDEFQSALQSKVERSAKCNKPVARSTAINEASSRVLRERNTPNKLRPITPVKTTPGKLNPPMWSPSAIKSPKTVPKVRRQSRTTRLTPACNRLPIII